MPLQVEHEVVYEECPICLTRVYPPIRQCVAGSAFCSQCFQRIHEYSVCKGHKAVACALFACSDAYIPVIDQTLCRVRPRRQRVGRSYNMDTDLVARNEVLKAQDILEEKARREWHAKWGFYLQLNEFCLEEAKKRGYSIEDYKRMAVKKKSRHNLEGDIWPPAPPREVPVTSTGFVGWRSGPNYSLEKFGSLYISPRHTLPYHPPYRCIACAGLERTRWPDNSITLTDPRTNGNILIESKEGTKYTEEHSHWQKFTNFVVV